MKPRNFPARKLLRAANAQGRRLSTADLARARGTRTKKTPKADWSAARIARRLGKVA